MESARGIFDVKSFDQGGLGEVETLALLDHFIDYVESVKKNTRTLPIPSNPMVESIPISEAVPPTPPISASGSTGDEFCTVGPEELTTECSPPSDSATPISNSGNP